MQNRMVNFNIAVKSDKRTQTVRSLHELERLAVDSVVIGDEGSVLSHLGFKLAVVIPVAGGKTRNGLDDRIQAEGESVSILIQVLFRHNVGEVNDESLFGVEFRQLLWVSIHDKYS